MSAVFICVKNMTVTLKKESVGPLCGPRYLETLQLHKPDYKLESGFFLLLVQLCV